MKLQLISPKITLDKAFFKQRPLKSEMEDFKTNLKVLLSKIISSQLIAEKRKSTIKYFKADIVFISFVFLCKIKTYEKLFWLR